MQNSVLQCFHTHIICTLLHPHLHLYPHSHSFIHSSDPIDNMYICYEICGHITSISFSERTKCYKALCYIQCIRSKYTYVHICTCTISKYTCVHVHVHMYMCMCTCTYIHVNVYMYYQAGDFYSLIIHKSNIIYFITTSHCILSQCLL